MERPEAGATDQQQEPARSAQNSAAIPSHVPADLVLPYAFSFGATTFRDPFSELVPPVHAGPEIFYALTPYAGGGPGWIVRRTADLRSIYMDTEHFSNEDFAPFAKLLGESWGLVPAETDPPVHQLYRAFVNPIFVPKAIDALDSKIRLYAENYVAALAPDRQCEFMSQFAFEFPIKVFLELMGLPQDDAPLFLGWVGDLLHAPDLETLVAATGQVVAFLRGVIEARKRAPTDDLVSYGVKAQIEGRKLTDDELLGFCFNLFVGGLDTASSNMGNHFWHLARHPHHQKLLREHPAPIPTAIGELMRAYGNVTTFRTCKKTITIKGITFMPGDKVAMSTTLAGRDPEEYERPNEIILDRKAKHVSFVYGPHLCVGMHLANREMKIAMEEFLAVIPEFEPVPHAEVEFLLHGVIQPKTLRLQWSSKS